MHGTGRSILAVLAGTVTAMATIAAVESLGHAVYPLPPDLDFSKPEQLAQFTATLPIGALLFVISAWLLGALVGGCVAGLIDRTRPRLAATIVGGLVLVATILNLLMIPHPAWFAVVGVLGVCAGTAAAIGVAVACGRQRR